MNNVKVNEREFRVSVHKEIVLNNSCKSILPVSKYNNTYLFNTSGYTSLRNIETVSAFQALSILELFTKAIDELKNYLFYTNEFVISPDTIYLDYDLSDLKFLMIPFRNFSREQSAFGSFIYHLYPKTDEKGKRYLRDFYNHLKAISNHTNLVEYIEKLKKEI